MLFQYVCDGDDIVKFQATIPSKGQKKKKLSKEEEKTDIIKPKPKQPKQPILIHHIVYSAKHDSFIIAASDKILRIIMHKDAIKKLPFPTTEAIKQNKDLFQLHRYKEIYKKASSIRLSPIKDEKDEEFLISADKFGVMIIHYLPSLKIKYNQTGHLSIISDIAFDPMGKYLISADKDFKIRISRFPKIFIIEQFCYGHTAAVTQCIIIDNKNKTNNGMDVEMKNDDDMDVKVGSKYILSGSTDGTIRIWDCPSGKELVTFQFVDAKNNITEDNMCSIECNLESKKDEELIVTEMRYNVKTNVLAVAFNKSSKVYLFEFCFETVKLELLGCLDLMTDSTEFCGLYDLLFDDQGNIMSLVCCKEKGETYMDPNVWLVTKTDGIVSEMKIEQCLDNVVIERIREQAKEISLKQEQCEARPFYLDLLRDWTIDEQIQKNHKEIKEAEANDESIGRLPPNKKRRIETEATRIR